MRKKRRPGRISSALVEHWVEAINEQQRATAKSIRVLVAALKVGANVDRLAKETGYPKDFVQAIWRRMSRAGLPVGELVDNLEYATYRLDDKRQEGMSETEPNSKRTVTLTQSDWAEIYYALFCKAEDIRKGRYEWEDDPGFLQEWAGWLEKIMHAIGSDGEVAAARGVEPCDITESSSAESRVPRMVSTIQ